MIFDYGNIEEILEQVFENYDVYLIKNSEMNFYVVVKLKGFLINKEIKEEYYLKKGDLYERVN